MPANPTAQRMGERHEEFLAHVNGGTKTRSSGNQWHDQGDGRDAHDAPFAFCWDGKSTRGKQIAVTLDMIAKIREQAQGERPQIGLRWYANDALDKVTEDWIAITAADFAEMKLAARRTAELETEVADLRDQAATADSLQNALGKAEEDLIGVRSELGGVREHRNHLREENERLRNQLQIEADGLPQPLEDTESELARLREELEQVTRQRDLEGRNSLNLARELESVKHRLQQEVDSALAYRRDLEQSRNSYARAMELLAEARSAAAAPADTGTDDPGRQSVESLQQILKAVEADRDRYRDLAVAAQKGRLIPPYVPALPWTVVYQVRLQGRVESSGMHYDADGNVTSFEVGTVRVERSIGSGNRPRLVVNETRVPDGDLYTDGVLVARSWSGNPDAEVG